jgi:hypothetical protein
MNSEAKWTQVPWAEVVVGDIVSWSWSARGNDSSVVIAVHEWNGWHHDLTCQWVHGETTRWKPVMTEKVWVWR